MKKSKYIISLVLLILLFFITFKIGLQIEKTNSQTELENLRNQLDSVKQENQGMLNHVLDLNEIISIQEDSLEKLRRGK